MENKRIKVTENFFLDEFVPKDLYGWLHGNVKELEKYQDPRIPLYAQFVRTTSGLPTFANNWWDGGSIDERGVRHPNTGTGAKASRHKYVIGTDGEIIRRSDGLDLQIADWSGKKMFEWAKEHRKELYDLGIRTVEHHSLTYSWLHGDMKARTEEEGVINIVDLKKIVEKWKI